MFLPSPLSGRTAAVGGRGHSSSDALGSRTDEIGITSHFVGTDGEFFTEVREQDLGRERGHASVQDLGQSLGKGLGHALDRRTTSMVACVLGVSSDCRRGV